MKYRYRYCNYMCVCRILKYVEINGIPACFNGRFQFQLDRFLSIEYV